MMRLRLAISAALTAFALVFATQALAAAPVAAGPGPDASFLTGTAIQFSATSTPDALRTGPAQRLDFYISKDVTVAPNTTTHYTVSSGAADPGSGVYSGSSDPTFLSKPGDYAWQPVDPECGLFPDDCFGLVRHFTITALPASAVTSASQVDTYLNKKPRHRTRKRKVKFTFSSNVEGAKFQCLFASGWEKCKSPHVFRRLKVGRYQFEVRAVVNGIEDTDPEEWLFRVLHRKN